MRNRFSDFCKILSLLTVAACSEAALVDRSTPDSQSLPDLPAMKLFSTSFPQHPTRSNRDLARDFIDLSFYMENGAELRTISRFEGPISLRVIGLRPPTLQRDLDDLLARLRNEAGISISQTNDEHLANITIHVITRRQLTSVVPNVACFVVPNVSDWQDYKSNRRNRKTDWRRLVQRERVTIFLPGDVSPQDIRDCLHEEIAQSLGPLNDLFRLPDSVFNDDNFHTVLTGTDMLFLRAYYSPRLRSGMNKLQVAANLPGILKQINPAGENLPAFRVADSPQAWRDSVAKAQSPRTNAAQRRAAIDGAIRQAQQWNDVRLGFALSIKGRFLASTDPQQSFDHFLAAYRLFATRPTTNLQAAHLAANLAIYALAAGEPEQALILLNSHIELVERSENAALLSTMLFARSEAYAAIGQIDRAQTDRQNARGWARYGFGSDRNVHDHENEIATIARRGTCPALPCSPEDKT